MSPSLLRRVDLEEFKMAETRELMGPDDGCLEDAILDIMRHIERLKDIDDIHPRGACLLSNMPAWDMGGMAERVPWRVAMQVGVTVCINTVGMSVEVGGGERRERYNNKGEILLSTV